MLKGASDVAEYTANPMKTTETDEHGKMQWTNPAGKGTEVRPLHP